jgi:hypothetical protein
MNEMGVGIPGSRGAVEMRVEESNGMYLRMNHLQLYCGQRDYRRESNLTFLHTTHSRTLHTEQSTMA